jgi:hypothetical protein
MRHKNNLELENARNSLSPVLRRGWNKNSFSSINENKKINE